MDTSRDSTSGLIIGHMSGVGGGHSGSISNTVSGVLIKFVRDACTEDMGFHPLSLLLVKSFVLKMLVPRTSVVLLYSVQGWVFLGWATSQYLPNIPY